MDKMTSYAETKTGANAPVFVSDIVSVYIRYCAYLEQTE